MTWPGGDSRLGPGQGEGLVFLGAGGGWSAGSGVRGCVQGAARGGHAGKPLPFFACAGPLCVAVPRGLPEEDQGVASRGKSPGLLGHGTPLSGQRHPSPIPMGAPLLPQPPGCSLPWQGHTPSSPWPGSHAWQ